MDIKRCYICNRPIKDGQKFYDIGQGLYRHQRCNPLKARKKNDTTKK